MVMAMKLSDHLLS